MGFGVDFLYRLALCETARATLQMLRESGNYREMLFAFRTVECRWVGAVLLGGQMPVEVHELRESFTAISHRAHIRLRATIPCIRGAYGVENLRYALLPFRRQHNAILILILILVGVDLFDAVGVYCIGDQVVDIPLDDRLDDFLQTCKLDVVSDSRRSLE